MATGATFKEPFARRRRLVVAHGWYECAGVEGSKERWLVTPKVGEPMTFGGCRNVCETADAGEIASFDYYPPRAAPLNA